MTILDGRRRTFTGRVVANGAPASKTFSVAIDSPLATGPCISLSILLDQ